MHHSRRKSGPGSANTSMTDVRKAASSSQRPKASPAKKSRESSHRAGRSPKERERDYYEYADDEDGRDTFPQYCMACEKQFLPTDDSCLYCSFAYESPLPLEKPELQWPVELTKDTSCREYDENASSHRFPSRGTASNGYTQSAGPYHPSYEPREIIPRASPSRAPSTYISSSPVVTTNDAISALRSLTIRPASPSSPTGGRIWPFSRGAADYPATYDPAYGKKGYGSSGGGYGYNQYGSSGAERPLPSRRPGGYSRPKSIELVTPMVGR
ncbi:uncharacterized protein DNG_01546 [Cephalotrichum gorgonifer]|uniref:Uncharacterized protein n=1 Tax=Cephalotrichum gorgonifer TaxID=2041049 RepID=A0AAE8MR26_9PEZI|nr:uncharacterized protein DNG_01546 [Cephalotrichum gorgonifer]